MHSPVSLLLYLAAPELGSNVGEKYVNHMKDFCCLRLANASRGIVLSIIWPLGYLWVGLLACR